ncbi:uncharacterized protein LOC113315752 [Papaver somniferum]|uniref:uncharacterized protein LOC113315752 n=1 Tax=Papaver somniferum TaxID=3469 RepID=UPI000E6F5BD2|nr:uncharacterized protein LOC113315752 [Papaver somniferum]
MDPIRPEFELLDSAGLEYYRWVLDVETIFMENEYTSTIKPSAAAAPTTEKEKAHALMFLKRHIDPKLRWGYHHLKTPKELWDALDSRTMDFCGKKLTDEEMIQKTLSTFPTSSMILANQYHLEVDNKTITTFSGLINLMQVAKKHNEILVNNNTRVVRKKKVLESNHGKVNRGKNPKRKRARHSDSHYDDPYPREVNTSRGRGRKGHNRAPGRKGHSMFGT